MKRDNQRPQNNRQNGSAGSRRRGGYEDDYAPHYSGQKAQKGTQSAGRRPQQNAHSGQQRSGMNDGYDQRNYSQTNYGGPSDYGEYAPNGRSTQGGRNAQSGRNAQGGRNARNNPYNNPNNNPQYGNNQPGMDPRGKKNSGQKKNKHMVGRVLAGIQGVLSIIVLALLFMLDVIPMKYLAVGAALLAVLWVFSFFSQFTRGTHIVGKVESVILCVILGMVTYYLFITNSFLGNITGSTIKIDNIVIAVMKDDPAQSLADAADYTFGIENSMERDKIDKTIAKINKNLGKDIATHEYEGLLQQIDDLYNGEVGAIIYNEAFKENILEQHPTFDDDVRTLDNVKIETKVEVAKSDKDVTGDAFSVYITGIDTYGEISTSGRSDVNIIATVNPETKQILLTTTPRDYYVAFPGVTNGELDKLTHAGIYGVDCSMNTLGELYGVKIDYYAKVNFTSLIKMVDQLGGVDVYSEYDFTSIDGIHFNKGYNYLDGQSALSFSRERKNLEGGDNQRGKNQQAVMTAMIKKAMSPAILANYAGLLGGLEGNFETSMSMNDITELIKMQLNDGGDWNIVSQSVVGSNGNDVCYSMKSYGPVYVMIPDDASVAAAAAQIQQVYNGETLQNTAPQE